MCSLIYHGKNNCLLKLNNFGDRQMEVSTASLHKLAAGRKLATTHLNVSNRQMCRCTAFRLIEISKYDDGGQLTTRGQLMQGSSIIFMITTTGKTILFPRFVFCCFKDTILSHLYLTRYKTSPRKVIRANMLTKY